MLNICDLLWFNFFVSIRFGLDELRRFVLTVKKNYRDVPYHNWTHAFAVAHSMYLVIRSGNDKFTALEVGRREYIMGSYFPHGSWVGIPWTRRHWFSPWVSVPFCPCVVQIICTSQLYFDLAPCAHSVDWLRYWGLKLRALEVRFNPVHRLIQVYRQGSCIGFLGKTRCL